MSAGRQAAASAFGAPRATRALALRSLGLFAFWVILTGLNDAWGLPVGLATAVIAARASLRLLPPSRRRVRVLRLPGYALRFLSQAIIAGVDVALRAFNPRLPLKPGYVTYPLRQPPGTARESFLAVMSLLPGTLPAGPDAQGNLVIHCLDRDQPVLTAMADEEARFLQLLDGDGRHA